MPLLVAAVGITLVSLTDTIALSTSFNAKRGEEVKPNQEMIGIGSANIAAGLFQGFAVSASSSRTAVAEQSGAKTQLTGVVGAGLVVLLLLFFNGLLADLPNSALAAVVIAAALSLADFAVLARVWKVRRSAVALSVVASAGVIFLGVLQGILVAVVLSILLFFQRNWWPHGEVLGRVPGREGWHSDSQGDQIVEHPGVLVFRWEAPLFFANSGMFSQQVRHLVRERRPGWVVLQCEAITDIDVTAAGMLERLDNELNAEGVHLAFVELRSRLRDLVHDYGLHRDPRPRPLLRLDRRRPRRHRPDPRDTEPEAHRDRRRSSADARPTPASGRRVDQVRSRRRSRARAASAVASPIVAPTTDPTMTSPG